MRFFESAPAGETFLNALITMTITFAVLVLLYALVRLFSLALGVFNKKKSAAEKENVTAESEGANGNFSAGTLILKDVDEETAAMIMAIVSDECGIPLERLIFRSIKLVK